MRTRKLFPPTSSIIPKVIMILFILTGSFGLPTNTHALGLAITVNTTADNTIKDGLCSLREAITNANKNYQFYADCTAGLSDDGIFFSNSLGTATITLSSTLPAIKDLSGLIINGGGDITVSGGGLYQVFVVNTRAPLTLDGLIVTRGRGDALSKGGGLYSDGGFVTIKNSTFLENGAANGGGIYSVGAYVTIMNSTFSRNGAGINVPGNNDGGGIYNDGSSMTITDSTFSQNGAYGEGGGIYIASGPTTITRSSFSGNGDQFIYGAGIYAASGQLTITLSTFSNNRANRAGGVFVSSGTAEIANSTFSGNTGGGLQNLGTMTIKNSTFSGNTANAGAGGIINMGTLNLFNTILANSIAGRDCFNNPGSTVTGNNNLIEADGLSPNTCGTATLAADPRLGVLTGSPAYHPLNSGSPAINAGDDVYCWTWPVSNTSQNGVTRPQGAHCEIGSYETVSALLQSPQEGIAALGSTVQGLIDQSALTSENGKILTSILDSSIDALGQDDTSSGIKTLNVFIEQVNIFIESGELESKQGQLLIDDTQLIIDSLY